MGRPSYRPCRAVSDRSWIALLYSVRASGCDTFGSHAHTPANLHQYGTRRGGNGHTGCDGYGGQHVIAYRDPGGANGHPLACDSGSGYGNIGAHRPAHNASGQVIQNELAGVWHAGIPLVAA